MTVAELIAVLSQYPDDMEVVLARFLSEDYDSVMLKDAEFDKKGAPTMRARFCCGVLKNIRFMTEQRSRLRMVCVGERI